MCSDDPPSLGHVDLTMVLVLLLAANNVLVVPA